MGKVTTLQMEKKYNNQDPKSLSEPKMLQKKA